MKENEQQERKRLQESMNYTKSQGGGLTEGEAKEQQLLPSEGISG